MLMAHAAITYFCFFFYKRKGFIEIRNAISENVSTLLSSKESACNCGKLWNLI
jgi:hypothetical protein